MACSGLLSSYDTGCFLAPEGSGGSSGNKPPNVYGGKKASPNWPKNFVSEHGKLFKVKVTNKELLEVLRNEYPGNGLTPIVMTL